MSFVRLFLTILLTFIPAGNVVADGVILEVSRVVNATGVSNLIAQDRARAKGVLGGSASSSVKEKPSPQDGNFSAGELNFAYVAMVGVGKPLNNFTLLIDTRSAVTWLGNNRPYLPSDTSIDTNKTLNITYGKEGNFSGKQYIEQLTFQVTPELQVAINQSIGVQEQTASPLSESGIDGILAIGPADLSIGTLSSDNQSSIPTVTDTLFTSGKILKNEIGIFFGPFICPEPQIECDGTLTWGGIDSSKIVGSVNYTSITDTSPSSNYWGIDQSIKFGDVTILSNGSGIVDTGTTFIMLATDPFKKYIEEIGAKLDETNGLYHIDTNQYQSLKSLYFETKEGGNLELVPDAQIWPRQHNNLIQGDPSLLYLIVIELETATGMGLDVIYGTSFLQRFYSVYDTTNKQVGFAETRFTRDETNTVETNTV